MKKLISLFLLVGSLGATVSSCGPIPSPTAVPGTPTVTSVARTATAVPPTPTSARRTPTPLPLTPTPVPEARTIIVASTADSGPGTLRQALLEAKSGDTITFDPTAFPPDTPATIYLTSGLARVSQGHLTIDASNAGVILDGSQISGAATIGLTIYSDGNTIQGLQIVGFSDNGLDIENGRQNVIGGDRSTGNGPLGQGNLISGNGGRGIVLGGGDHSTIEGNLIGTDLTGSTAWGNHLDGIHLNGSGHNRIVGNLVSGNWGPGIDLTSPHVSHNTIEGNLIGTDISGLNPLGNGADGVAIHDGASHNVVGSDNVIAYNHEVGLMVAHAQTWYITITRNNIYSNGSDEIDLRDGSNGSLSPPSLFFYDLSAGRLAGTACDSCTVEIFSQRDDAGALTYEGLAVAGSAGLFSFDRGASFAGAHVICTATDVAGNTSDFSMPTLGASIALQEGNPFPVMLLQTRSPAELPDHAVGGDILNWVWSRGQYNTALYEGLVSRIRDLGIRWVRVAAWSPHPLNWQEVLRLAGEYSIPQDVDDFITELANDGVSIVLNLSAGAGLDGPEHGCWGGPGWGVLGAREPEWWFAAQAERDQYTEYARFMVEHFRGRVEYYEIWNEPSDGEVPGDCRGGVTVSDYVSLVKQVAPIIRETDPEARIVVGAMGRFREDYRQWLQAMLDAGVAPLVDAISWHPFYGESPLLYSGEYPRHPEPFYWRDYPSKVEDFMHRAAERGFEGEYMVEEMVWRTQNDFVPHETPHYTDIVAAKYAARANVTHLGLNFTMVSNQLQMPDVIKLLPRYYVIRNLSTVMAGAEPVALPVEIQSEAQDVVTYSFALPSGDYLVAVWTDVVAVDHDPGVEATLTVQGLSAQKVTGIDVLYGCEQQMVTEVKDGSLVVPDLLVKDYPIILRLTH